MSMIPRGYESFSTLSSSQQNILNQLLPRLLGSLGEEGAGKFGAPFERKFYEETIPGIAERFSGLGAGSQSSSAFQQALGQAGAGLSEQLGGLSAQREQTTIGNLLNLLSQNQQGLVPKSKSFLQELLLGLSGGLGQGLGSGLGALTGRLF